MRRRSRRTDRLASPTSLWIGWSRYDSPGQHPRWYRAAQIRCPDIHRPLRIARTQAMPEYTVMAPVMSAPIPNGILHANPDAAEPGLP